MDAIRLLHSLTIHAMFFAMFFCLRSSHVGVKAVFPDSSASCQDDIGMSEIRVMISSQLISAIPYFLRVPFQSFKQDYDLCNPLTILLSSKLIVIKRERNQVRLPINSLRS